MKNKKQKTNNKEKTIRVKPLFGAHQIYQEIVNNPPENVKYLGVSKETSQGKYYENKKMKEFFGKILKLFNIPRFIFVNGKGCDLIHTSRGIIPLQIFSRKPWVMDIEHVHSFFGLDPSPLRKKFWKRFIEKKIKSKKCKGILCHCEATRQSFFNYLDCKDFKYKIKVLYPSSKTFKIKMRKNKKIVILCIFSDFLWKGGFFVLETFQKISRKFPEVNFVLKADVPKKMKKKYKINNLEIFSYSKDIVPRKKLIEKFYSKSDIFFYPTLTDSFGYSLIDGLVAGTPIVGSNLFAVPEVIQHNKNGLVVKIPGYNLKNSYRQSFDYFKVNKLKYVKNLEKALIKLIKNRKLRKKMGEESFRLISKGKFSIKERNKKLKKVYEEALK